jgi:hypothetical protein
MIRQPLFPTAPWRRLHGARMRGRRLITAAFLVLSAPAVVAAPWAAVGDSALRSDLETLAASGVIDNLTTTWPIPWSRILERIQDEESLARQPEAVQDAARRVKARASSEVAAFSSRLSSWIDATNSPNPVRGFDALGRQNAQGQAVVDWNGDGTTVHLAVGAESHDIHDRQTLMMDDTYVAQSVWGTAVYAGWVTHWWGPGWISTLSESNNARPIPQVGITRMGSAPFKTPLLRWIGPWQAEFFIGILDGPRLDHNTVLNGLKVSMNPLPGFEWGFERMDEACGHNHPCDLPRSWFNPQNNYQHPSSTNDQLDFDFKYMHTLGSATVSVYMQLMNEDSNPIYRSGTSHLAGLTSWLPIAGQRVRLTAEWTSTVPTANIMSFGDYAWGFAYNDYKYPDGMRYRDRATGFSLDSNSKLYTLQASWTTSRNIGWTLTYHHARVADMITSTPPGTGYIASTYNPVSAGRVTFDMGEVRANVPVSRQFTVDASVRYQTDQLRPAQGAETAGEMRVSYALY